MSRARLLLLALGLSTASVRALGAEPRATVAVVDEDGRPLASARLSPSDPAQADLTVLDPVAAPGLEADEQGRLALPPTPRPEAGGAWVVWAPGRAARRLPPDAAGTRLALPPAAPVRGSVRWSDGRAAGALDVLVEPLGVPEPVALRVRTDAQGRWRTDLAAGTAWRVSYRRADGRWAPLRTAGAGEHVAPRPGGLRGRLLDGRASGSVGVPALAVRLVTLPRGVADAAPALGARTAADGTFALSDVPAGVYELEVLDLDWMFDQPHARVEVPGEGTVREETWFVVRRASLTGQVRGHEERPVPGARVRLLPDPRRAGTPAAPLTTPPAVTTDAEGRFRFDRLVPAPGYRLLASAEGFGPYLSAPFAVDPGGETAFGPLTLPSGWSLDVEVRDAASKFVTGARLRATSAGHPSAALDPAFEAFTATATTDEGGEASFTGLALEDVWLAVTAPGHLPWVERVRRPGTSSHLSLKVSLLPAPTLSGTLVDALGRPAAGHVVRARPHGLGGAEPLEAVTGADGRFAVRDVPLEPLDVDVLADGGRVLLHVEGVDPQATLDLALPPLQVVTGTVEGLTVEGEAGEVLLEAPVLVPEEPEPRWRTVGHAALPRGRPAAPFRFEGLAPGRYAVRALQGGRASEAAPLVVEEDPAEPLEPVGLVLPEGGSVAGTVVDGRGLPQVGVEVRLVRLRADGAALDAPGGPLATATGQRGGYVFSGVAAGLWRVEAGERGGGMDLEVVRVVDGESLVVRDLSVGAGGALEGRVEDDRGRAVDGARLTLRALDHDLRPFTAVTGGDGGYRVSGLPHGAYEAVLSDGPRVRFRREALVAVTEGETATLDFVAGGSGEIQGTVLRGGKRATGVPLVATWLPEEGEALERAQRVVTDGTGAFRLEGLPAGTYRLVLEDGAARTGGDVTLDDAERRTVDLELWEGRIAGEVLTKEGRPVAGALVTATPSVPVVGVLTATARTDPAGRFTLPGLPVARYDLVARAPGALEGTLRGAQADAGGGGRPVTVRLGAGARLDVEVRGVDGRPAGGVRLTVRADGPDGSALVVAFTGPTGRLVVDGVPAGRVRVVAEARDAGRAAETAEAVEGTVVPVRLTLLPTGSLTLDVRGAGSDVLRRARIEVRRTETGEVVLTRTPRPGASAWTSGLRWRLGLLEARDLPAGDYEVRLDAGPGWAPGRALVRVRAGETTAATLDLAEAPR